MPRQLQTAFLVAPHLTPRQVGFPAACTSGRKLLTGVRPLLLQVQDSEGKEIRDGVTGRGAGYRYFGAAKQLPGVRELFEKEPPRKVDVYSICAVQSSLSAQSAPLLRHQRLSGIRKPSTRIRSRVLQYSFALNLAIPFSPGNALTAVGSA